jgi:thiol-disulfide isomerase/thioredoxin
MHKIVFFVCLAFLPNFSFAEKSEILPLPKVLQVAELPWFALPVKDSEESYNGVLNKNKLKSISMQKNSKKVVLAFYATWCMPCKEGLKRMSNKAAELEKNGVLVALVNVAEKKFDFGKVNKWIMEYAKEGWLLGFDEFGDLPEKFGLTERGGEMPLPKTLLLDSNLRPLVLIGQEGDDFLQILLSEPRYPRLED